MERMGMANGICAGGTPAIPRQEGGTSRMESGKREGGPRAASVYIKSSERRKEWLDFVRCIAELDVCAVVETWFKEEDEAALEVELAGLGYVWFGRQQRKEEGGEGRGGVGFLVRKELEVKVLKKGKGGNLMWISVGKIDPWYLAVAYVAPSRTSSRTEEYYQVIEEIGGDVEKWRGRVVIMGDFNSRIGEMPNVMLEGEDDTRVECARTSSDVVANTRGRHLLKEMNALGLVVANGVREKAEHTSYQVGGKHKKGGSSVIDLIWVAWESWHEWGGMKVWDEEEAGIDSDHRVVTGTLKVEEGKRKETEGKKQERKAWRRKDRGERSFWDELEWYCTDILGRWCEMIEDKIEGWERGKKEVCEEAWKDWLAVHNEAAEKGVGYQKERKKKRDENKGGVSRKVKRLVQMKNKMRKQLAKVEGKEREELWEEYRKLKTHVKHVRRRERRRKEVEWSSELAKLQIRDSREYWAKLRAMAGVGKGGREVPGEMRKGEGLVGGIEAMNIWMEAFKKLGRADGGDERYDKGFWEETRKLVEEWGKGREEGEEELDEPIRLGEVRRAIDQLRRGKAPGVDGVVNEVLKYGGEGMTRALHVLFGCFFERERVPIDWTRGLVVPLYKDGDKHMADNYRGITLLSVVGKLYTVILNSRLSKWCEKKGVLVDEQAGFRVNRSTVDQIYALREVIQGRRREKRKDSYCCFLDIKKAYDTVFREGLWRRMREVGVVGKMWRVLKNIYVKVESSVVVNAERTDWFELYTGVRQGCILSPTLFAIFIDGLANLVKQCSVGAKFGPVELSILLFADDIVLVADNIQNLQKMLYVADEYSKMYRFGFNGSKSNVVVFSGKKEVKLDRKVYLGSLELEQKMSYKYLGLELDKMWKWGKVKERMIEKARKRLVTLCGAGVKQGLSVRAAVKGWEVLVRPVLEYGCEIWGEGGWPEVERLQNWGLVRR
jgi:hypothetical protein